MSASTPADLPLVSVIIPVFNDRERLLACLAAIEVGDWPQARLDVLVIDNGGTLPLRDDLSDGRPWLRVAHESQPGSYAARNRGIALARGSLIAFTDSDCLPAADWVRAGVRALAANPGAGIVAGEVQVFARDAARPNAVELYELVSAFPQRDYVARQHFSVTANLFTRAEVVQSVGPFDAALRSGGDGEWGRRVHAAGYAVVFAADVVVRHPARADLRGVLQKTRRVMGGLRGHDAAATRDAGRAQQAQRVARRWAGLLGNLPLQPLRYAASPRLHGPGQRLRVFGVTLAVRLVMLAEWLRLTIGGAPLR